MFNFKVGDKVYFPRISNKVLTLKGKKFNEFSLIRLDLEGYTITAEGKYFDRDVNLSIFPATQEWYAKLVHVYPNLEKPPKEQ